MEIAIPRQETLRLSSVAVICILMLFAAAVAAIFLLPQSLGLDEAQSMWQSAHTVVGLLPVVAEDVHVPLYHLLLHFWQLQFGNGVATARLLSLLFYLATIPLVYILGRIAFGKESVGIFAAAIFTLSPFADWYGSVIRMYSLLAFFTVLNQVFFLLIFRSKSFSRSWYWLGFAVSGFFGMYTHYFFFFTLAADAVFLLMYRKSFPKYSLRNFLLALVLLIILLSPWIFYVRSLGGLGKNTSPKLTAPTTIDLANTFSNFFFGFQNDTVNTIILSTWPIIVLFIFFGLQKNKQVPPEAVYFIITITAPIAGAAILSHIVTPFYLSRYFLGVFPSLCLATSWFISLYQRTASSFIKTALVFLMVAMFGAQIANASSSVKEDYQGAADYTTQNATARDIVAVSTPFTVYPVEYYYRGQATLTTLPVWNRLITGPIPSYDPTTIAEEVTAFSKIYDRLYVILSYDQGFEGSLRLYLDTHYKRIYEKTYSPGLSLYGYELRYDRQTLADAMKIANGTLPPSSASSFISPSMPSSPSPQTALPPPAAAATSTPDIPSSTVSSTPVDSNTISSIISEKSN